MYPFHTHLRLDQIVRLETLDTCCPMSEKLRQAVDEYLTRREGGAFMDLPPLAVLEKLETDMSKRLAQCRAEISALNRGESK